MNPEQSLPPTGSNPPQQQAPVVPWWKQIGLNNNDPLTGSATGDGFIQGGGKNPGNGKAFVTQNGNRYYATTFKQNAGGKKFITLTLDPTANDHTGYTSPEAIANQKDVVTHFTQTPDYQNAKSAGYELTRTGGAFGNDTDAEWYTMSPNQENFEKNYGDLGTPTVSMRNKLLGGVNQRSPGTINGNLV